MRKRTLQKSSADGTQFCSLHQLEVNAEFVIHTKHPHNHDHPQRTTSHFALAMTSSDNICLYTYKPCTNPRSLKKNGSLHCFCDYHRLKANATQKAHAAKKRLKKAIGSGSAISPNHRISEQLAAPKPFILDLSMPLPIFDENETQILQELLFDPNVFDSYVTIPTLML